MTRVHVLVIYGVVVGVFHHHGDAQTYRERHHPKDEWRIYDCMVR